MPPKIRVPGAFDLSVVYRTNVAMSSYRKSRQNFAHLVPAALTEDRQGVRHLIRVGREQHELDI